MLFEVMQEYPYAFVVGSYNRLILGLRSYLLPSGYFRRSISVCVFFQYFDDRRFLKQPLGFELP